MRNIIVVGYPKSGCTWVTRLVAELVSCPVAGFWRSDKKEIAVEGEDRVSDSRVFKSHHTFAELGVDPSREETPLIYVVRDPRDIAVSGANYFHFARYPGIERLFRLLPSGAKLYRHTLYPLLVPETYRMERMTEAVLVGLPELHRTVGIPWKQHYEDYKRPGVLIVSYEELLAAPQVQGRRMVDHLKIERGDAEIDRAIRNQSFAVKKAEFANKGEGGRAKFLRVGKSGQWHEKLPARAKERFAQQLPSLALLLFALGALLH